VIKREVSPHVRVIKDTVADLVERLMFISILKTMEVFQHAYCQRFSESARAEEEDGIVEFM
jgi:hypothetical protein